MERNNFQNTILKCKRNRAQTGRPVEGLYHILYDKSLTFLQSTSTGFATLQPPVLEPNMQYRSVLTTGMTDVTAAGQDGARGALLRHVQQSYSICAAG